MLFGGPWTSPFPPYFGKYLHPVVFFFFSLCLSLSLLMRLCALQDVVLFHIGRWDGDSNVDGEGEKRQCHFFFAPSLLWCWAFAVRGCSGVCALLVSL